MVGVSCCLIWPTGYFVERRIVRKKSSYLEIRIKNNGTFNRTAKDTITQAGKATEINTNLNILFPLSVSENRWINFEAKQKGIRNVLAETKKRKAKSKPTIQIRNNKGSRKQNKSKEKINRKYWEAEYERDACKNA